MIRLIYALTSFLFINFSFVHAVEIDSISYPMADGDRTIKFSIDLESTSFANFIKAEVFYSYSYIPLDNLNSSTLPGGKCIIYRTSDNQRLSATFVLPHEDHSVGPNRDLFYIEKFYDFQPLLVNMPELGMNSITDFAHPLLPSVIDYNPRVFNRGECVYFRIKVSFRSGGQNQSIETDTISFVMPDTYNIGIIGDSYASGEGAPEETFEVFGDNSDLWSREGCHRSKYSGLVRGVKKFIFEHPEIGVDYMHRACSAAQISDVIDRTQDGSEGMQLQELKDIFITGRGHSQLHLIVISIGGNNAGFVPYMLKYLLGLARADLDDFERDSIQIRLANLDNRYDDLNNAIHSEEFFPNARVIITTYPDPTTGAFGRCGNILHTGSYLCCMYETHPLHNPDAEHQFTSDFFIGPLNDIVRQNAQDHNWRVADVENNMLNHGFCNCSDPYVNLMTPSLLTQGDVMGYMHPNRKGYKNVYRNPVYSSVLAEYTEYWSNFQLLALITLIFGPEPLVKPCTPNNFADIFTLLNNLRKFKIKVPKILQYFLIDKAVVRALKDRDMKKLKSTVAYKKVSRSKDLKKEMARLLPSPTKRRHHVQDEKISWSDIEVEMVEQFNIKKDSLEVVEQNNNKILEYEKDVTDDLFNRPIKK